MTTKTGTGGKKADDERASDQPQTQTTAATPDFSETSPANAGVTSGSSSTTTSSNVQSVAVQSTPSYSNLYSANPLTQGANRGLVTDVQNSSETARAMSDTSVANPTVLGVNSSVVNPSQLTSQYTAQQSMISPLATSMKNHPTPQGSGGMLTGTNTDNQFLHNESGSIRHAEERRNKFVNQNKFIANPTPQPTAPIPTKIYTRTNLLDQAGEDSNPLSILDGNPFVAPAQRFLPQINEEFAPRPELKSFTTDPYIGVHKTSPIAPNSDNEVSQRKGVMDWLQEIRTHKYFPLLIAGGVVVIIISILKGRRN
jgi:hypothetical protein|tara:strand:+ start:5070 stop:6005 length:936 start_codon:yes stop_codon:yes gene_type:complete